jgi:hypothetical protein
MIQENLATPAGFESVRGIFRQDVDPTKGHQDEGLGESTSGHAGPKCNECNEVTPRLAAVAKNALLNGDFPRAIEILDRLSARGARVGDGDVQDGERRLSAAALDVE